MRLGSHSGVSIGGIPFRVQTEFGVPMVGMGGLFERVGGSRQCMHLVEAVVCIVRRG